MKINLFKKLLLPSFLLLGGIIYAQSVSGVVSDASGPIPGVNVLVKGTTTGSQTDFDGNYSVNVNSSDAVLVFSFLGYATQVIPVNGQTTINVTLAENASELDEVVIIGYGQTRKGDATGAIDAIGSDDFTAVNATSPAEILQGKVAGVQVTQASGEPGGAIKIRVRGNSSIRSGNDPLIVVDGIPLSGGNVSAGGSDIGLGSSSAKNPLNFINQNDIESINVLKDASSTAIYGSRGANGVILITTKKGKSGAPRLEYSTSLGVATVAGDLGLMSSAQYAEQAAANGVPNLDHGGSGYNLENSILQTAITQTHYLSAGFSGENSRTRFSLGYFDQEGIVQKTGTKKYSLNFNNNLDLFNGKVKFDSNIIVSQIEDEGQTTSDNAGFIGSLIGTAIYWNPTYNVRNSDGSFNTISDTYLNPEELLAAYKDNTSTTKILANFSPSIKINDNLNYKFVFGVDYSTSARAGQLLPSFQLQNFNGTTEGGDPAGGAAFLNDVTRFNKTFENIITYNKTISENFDLKTLLGYSYYRYDYKEKNVNAKNFNANQINLIDNIEGGNVSDFRVNSGRNSSELQSFFARAETVIYQNLLVNASLRIDGSSKVGVDNTYGTFPAIGAAYKFFEEHDGYINNLKLRLNWGIVGNQEIDVNSSRARGQYSNGSLSQSGNANANLKWETTTSYGVGVDYKILNNVSGSIDYFFKSTEDLVFPQPGASNVPNNAGATTFVNLPGTLESSGMEFAVNWDAIQNDDFSLSLSGNAAFLDNKMKDFPLFILTGGINGQGLSGASASVITNNQPIYSFFLNEWRGFDASGNSIYAAPDGSDTGLGGAVKKLLNKTAVPDINVGFNINTKYKKFELNAALYGQYGGYLYNNTANALFFKGSFLGDRNVPSSVAASNQAQGDPNSPSTQYLESSDFLRLANLSLGYNFDGDQLGKYVNSLRVSLSATNLFVITPYSGFDPEVDTNKQINGVNSAGIDYFTYPSSRGFTLGLTVGF